MWLHNCYTYARYTSFYNNNVKPSLKMIGRWVTALRICSEKMTWTIIRKRSREKTMISWAITWDIMIGPPYGSNSDSAFIISTIFFVNPAMYHFTMIQTWTFNHYEGQKEKEKKESKIKLLLYSSQKDLPWKVHCLFWN